MWREILHRKPAFVAATLAVALALALAVSVVTLCEASKRETIRLMRNMGFNVLIVPQGVDMADFWSEDFARKEMPEEYVRRLGQTPGLHIQHLVARLQKRVEWRGRKILLTGILPEVQPTYMEKKSPMGPAIPPGQVYLGHELWQSAALEEGDQVEVGGRAFTVARCLPEDGSKNDIRIFAHLHDVQDVLGKPGAINEIEALSCQCQGDRLATIRADLAWALPGTQVTETRSRAVAREETRQMVARYASLTIPAVVLVCAVLVGVLALLNVRERRVEIGILRASGVGPASIGALFLGKAAVTGLIGAALGFALGTCAAVQYGPDVFPLTARQIQPDYALLLWALAGCPAVCVLAAYLPALEAILQDPAPVLAQE